MHYDVCVNYCGDDGDDVKVCYDDCSLANCSLFIVFGHNLFYLSSVVSTKNARSGDLGI